MKLLRYPVVAVILALAFGGLLGAAAFLVSDRRPGPAASPSTTEAQAPTTTIAESPQAAHALLAAWQRSRTGTYVVEVRFERETETGGRLVTTTRVVQRPPDRLTVGEDTVDGRLDGRRFACARDEDDVLRCRDGGPAPPYEEDVQSEIAKLERLVAGDQPLYGVADEGGGCFGLRLLYVIHAPPYGVRARLCFDAVTGALVASEVRREDSVDRLVATTVRAEVSDEDLRLPEGAA